MCRPRWSAWAMRWPQNPGNDDIRYDYVKLLIGAGQLGDAAAAAGTRAGADSGSAALRSPVAMAQRHGVRATDERGAWTLEQFDEKIAENKRDFETRFAKSRVLMAHGGWTEAMDELLEIIMRDKQVERGERRARPSSPSWSCSRRRGPRPGEPVPGKTAGGIELAGKSRRAGRPASRAGVRLPAQAQHDAELNGPGRAPTAQAVSRCSASWYLAAVFSITSRGRCGAGGVLSHGLPLMRTCSSQSRRNCLS
jgi:hypothetical protein